MERTRDYYHDLRQQYRPDNIKLVIVAESPPISGHYFYDAREEATDPLFSALMKQRSFSPDSKEIGLKELKRSGWILVDATYEQVNECSASKRNRTLEASYKELIHDLEGLIPDKSAPLILVKMNVCWLLMPKLLKDGYKVLNRGNIPFPSHGHQPRFHRLFGELIVEGNSVGQRVSLF